MLPAALLPLLEPLERFEAIRRKAVRLGDRLCDLSYANPYQGAQDGARRALRAALEEERPLGLQYAPFGGQTLARRHVADALRRSHGLPFAWQDVILTPGAMSALQIGLRAAVGEGDEVVLPVPCWLDYPLYVRHQGAVPVMVPPGRDLGLDLDAIAAAITPRTRALLLAHPANPTGRNEPPARLAALAAMLAERAAAVGTGITLIADETHRDFTPPGAYHSLAGHHPRTLLVYSFGKYHFMQGQRLGYVAVAPDHPGRAGLAAELERWTRVTGIATPTALMQQAIPQLLALAYDQSWLEGWRRRLSAGLRTAGYAVAEAEATLFLYVRTPPGWDDWGFTQALAHRGVLVLPAPVFHHAGWFRLALTGSEPMLERALAGLHEAVSCPA